MKTKVVYCLVSDKSDLYYEQLVLSVFSLRKVTPSVTIVLLVDEETDRTLNGDRVYALSLIDSKVVVKIPALFTSKNQHSRYLKTKIRDFIAGDFLYIDTDTLIYKDITAIDKLRCSLGAVLDEHMRVHYSSTHPQAVCCNALGVDINKSFVYNGGLLYVKDNLQTHLFFNKWHEYWMLSEKIGKFGKDQPALTRINNEMNLIQQIDDRWNVIAGSINLKVIELIKNAAILHFCFTYSEYYPYKNLLNELRRKNKIDEEIERNISLIYYGMKDDNTFLFSRSSVYLFFLSVFVKHNFIFRIIDKCIEFFRTNHKFY